jgi:hypothetical protein
MDCGSKQLILLWILDCLHFVAAMPIWLRFYFGSLKLPLHSCSLDSSLGRAMRPAAPNLLLKIVDSGLWIVDKILHLFISASFRSLQIDSSPSSSFKIQN